MISKFRLNRFAIALVFAVIFVAASIAETPLLRVKVGDTLSVHIVGAAPQPSTGISSGATTTAPAGDPRYQVLSDGTIQSHDFGILRVEGLTIPEVTQRVHDRLAKRLNHPAVSVILDSEAPLVVFLSGSKSGGGQVKLTPDMDLRQLLASSSLDDKPDQFEAHVFRINQRERRASVQDILSGASPLSSLKLQANDVVSILPLDFIRVWVTGDVVHPGEIAIKPTDDLYRAVAVAGGAISTAAEDADARISLRRGPNTSTYAVRQDPKAGLVPLEPGDTIVVNSADKITVTISGEVKTPGNITLRSPVVLDQAVAEAGGLTSAGTGRSVTILRDGKQLSADAASSTDKSGLGSFKLENHDVILVKQNTEFAIAVGWVKTQGRVYIPDGQPMRLIDVVTAAGGIVDKGTARHVFVGHPDANGLVRVKEYRLDRYLREGDAAGNPLIVPGDVVTVQPSATPTVDVLQQALSAALLVYGVSQAVK